METLIGQNPAPTGAAPSGAEAAIVEGDQKNFMRDVIDASRTLPVLVDFWATWCGPCKTLTPILEKIVRAAGGRLKLVKIDIDRNQALVQQLAGLGLPLQSVPTVAAFWQGQIADLFQGALPESEVRRFAEALLKMAGGAMPSADLLAEARAAAEQGNHEEAAEIFAALLQEEPEKPEAWGGLARALLALGREDEAKETLDQAPAKIAGHAEVAGARSALALAAEGRAARDQLGAFEARLAADPADHQARYDLALALIAEKDTEGAIDQLLELFLPLSIKLQLKH